MQDKKILLIVEDEAPIRNALRDKLTHDGFVVLEAKNGKEGLEVALRERPGLILLDIIMPVMDGITMLKLLREENTYGKHVPVIILTNLSVTDDKMLAAISKDLPMYYLIKSDWKLEDVVTKVREKLEK